MAASGRAVGDGADAAFWRKRASSSRLLGGADGRVWRRGGATQTYQNATHPSPVEMTSTKSRSAFSNSIAGLPRVAAARRGGPSSFSCINRPNTNGIDEAPKLQ